MNPPYFTVNHRLFSLGPGHLGVLEVHDAGDSAAGREAAARWRATGGKRQWDGRRLSSAVKPIVMMESIMVDDS